MIMVFYTCQNLSFEPLAVVIALWCQTITDGQIFGNPASFDLVGVIIRPFDKSLRQQLVQKIPNRCWAGVNFRLNFDTGVSVWY